MVIRRCFSETNRISYLEQRHVMTELEWTLILWMNDDTWHVCDNFSFFIHAIVIVCAHLEAEHTRSIDEAIDAEKRKHISNCHRNRETINYQCAAHITHCSSISVAPHRNEQRLPLTVHISTCHGQLYGIASCPPTIFVSEGGIGVKPQSSTANDDATRIERLTIQFSDYRSTEYDENECDCRLEHDDEREPNRPGRRRTIATGRRRYIISDATGCWCIFSYHR